MRVQYSYGFKPVIMQVHSALSHGFSFEGLPVYKIVYINCWIEGRNSYTAHLLLSNGYVVLEGFCCLYIYIYIQVILICVNFHRFISVTPIFVCFFIQRCMSLAFRLFLLCTNLPMLNVLSLRILISCSTIRYWRLPILRLVSFWGFVLQRLYN